MKRMASVGQEPAALRPRVQESPWKEPSYASIRLANHPVARTADFAFRRRSRSQLWPGGLRKFSDRGLHSYRTCPARWENAAPRPHGPRAWRQQDLAHQSQRQSRYHFCFLRCAQTRLRDSGGFPNPGRRQNRDRHGPYLRNRASTLHRQWRPRYFLRPRR